MYSLSGGRWPARKRATSDPTPMNQPNKGEVRPGGGWGGKGAGQGEHCSVLHEPDTEQENTCPRD